MKRLILAVFAVLTACGGSDGGTGPAAPVLATIQVTLSSPTARVGETITATAAGFDATGSAMPTGGVSWGSSSNGIATVSAAG
ncbi:MAG: hypothetical protein ABI852_21805, partial [Gemmatimonadaceae bacterium]